MYCKSNYLKRVGNKVSVIVNVKKDVHENIQKNFDREVVCVIIKRLRVRPVR